jgi:hypothetical protein
MNTKIVRERFFLLLGFSKRETRWGRGLLLSIGTIYLLSFFLKNTRIYYNTLINEVAKCIRRDSWRV